MTKMTKVKLTYFKESGKYYSSGEYQSEQIMDFNIFKEVRNWNSYFRDTLPGLASYKWFGYILVEPENGVPALIDCGDNENNSG